MIVSFFACAIVLTLLLFVRRGTEKSFLQQQLSLIHILLRSWNVDMIQGYYFSRPLPPGDLLRLLTEEAVEQLSLIHI